MARIPLVEYETAPREVRALYDAHGGPGQRNVAKLFANQADFLAGFYAFVDGLYRHNELPARLRELAYLRASQLNSCHY